MQHTSHLVINTKGCARKLIPHEELLEFCPELLHDPEYQWMETVHHADKISSNKYNLITATTEDETVTCRYSVNFIQ